MWIDGIKYQCKECAQIMYYRNSEIPKLCIRCRSTFVKIIEIVEFHNYFEGASLQDKRDISLHRLKKQLHDTKHHLGQTIEIIKSLDSETLG